MALMRPTTHPERRFNPGVSVPRFGVVVALCSIGALAFSAPLRAQWPSLPSPGIAPPPVLLGSDAQDRLRLKQLLGEASTKGSLLRSMSSINAPLPGERGRLRVAVYAPQLEYIDNTGIAYSLNDGALWGGRGWSRLIMPVVRGELGPIRIFYSPELARMDNKPFDLWSIHLTPSPPGYRSPLSSPWGVPPRSIDLPLRFGAGGTRARYAGQSSAVVGLGRVELGVSSENNWWGPGQRNAILLSNNAPGFPHLFVRTGAPILTRVGAFEARWLVGKLSESAYFDTISTNNHSSLSALAVTWTPRWEDGLTLGLARSVFARARRKSDPLRDFYQVFSDVGRPNDVLQSDTTVSPGRDQVFSVFGRWVFPQDRFELYFEWARYGQPASLRDFLIDASHTRGYTAGLQWLSNPVGPGRVNLSAEVTNLEQDPSFRSRPIGSWYTSRAVVQGYTNEGQVLGAAIGPGASSQYLAADYVATRWRGGVFAGRVRWNNDAWGTESWPIGEGWCKHDVSLLSGVKTSFETIVGRVGVEYTHGRRLNVFFKNFVDCPLKDPNGDVVNNSLSLRFSLPGIWFGSGGAALRRQAAQAPAR